MSGPSVPSVRYPAVAGQFYPADPDECRRQAQSYLDAAPAAPSAKRGLGGIVPHAGWICSAAVAGQTLSTLAANAGPVDLVVVFGAIHSPIRTDSAALDSHHRWFVPGGESDLPMDLEAGLQQRGNLFVVDDRLHIHEHAVEVNLPLIQLAFPTASVLPVEVPVIDAAGLIGRKTAQTVIESGLRAVYLASSDFTHYGPNYRFTPAGVGPAAIQWAKDNDRRLLQLVENMAVDQIVPEVRQRASACGAGAIAAMLAACREVGAIEARVLRHTNSYETLADVAPQPPTNAVGYAAVVVE